MIETQRLVLRRITEGDDDFILELLNDPSFLQNIGDRGVRTAAQARRFILEGPIASYERLGFGLYLVELRGTGVPIGICGLLQRDWLEEVDVGFAFLPRYWSNGYAFESASAVLTYARETLGLGRIVAITSPDNHGSRRVLEKLGMRVEGTVTTPGGDEVARFVPHA